MDTNKLSNAKKRNRNPLSDDYAHQMRGRRLTANPSSYVEDGPEVSVGTTQEQSNQSIKTSVDGTDDRVDDECAFNAVVGVPVQGEAGRLARRIKHVREECSGIQ